MITAPESGLKKYRVALAGNPNCGKTTIFNALTGANQHVGNYPGVTVECKSGEFTLGGKPIELLDIPGIYSLSSSSPEEEVSFDALTSAGIDLIVNVVNCAALQRNLYLTTQLAELHIPMILVFNMSDEAEQKGLVFDTAALSQAIGSPIVKTVGYKGGGQEALCRQIELSLADPDNHDMPKLNYGNELNDSIDALAARIDALKITKYAHIPAKFFAIKLLEKDKAVLRLPEFADMLPAAEAEIKHLRDTHAIDEADTFMADSRYALISGICRTAVRHSAGSRREISDKIDTVMTHPFFGFFIFLAIMYGVFQLTFSLAETPMAWIESAFSALSDVITRLWPAGRGEIFHDMLTDGIISGVGGVLVFLPSIMLMFMALAALEDSGYMARAAFVMDGLMRRFGLQGKSFVPLILGFGCNVPAIMATRSIESEHDRKATIMVIPMMSCAARLQIYLLLIPMLVTEKYQGLMLWLIYLIGVGVALLAALFMKSTLFKGNDEVFIMELPPYRCPTLRSVLLHMWEHAKMYVRKAGTIILAASVVLFLCNKYPEKPVSPAVTAETPESAWEKIEYTVSGRVGKALEPFLRPLGFDWKIGTALVSSLIAKEVFVSQMGVINAVGDGNGETGSRALREKLKKQYTPLQTFCVLLFCLLSIPCIATLAVSYREMNSWKLVLAQCALLLGSAYALTFLTFQIGTLFRLGVALP